MRMVRLVGGLVSLLSVLLLPVAATFAQDRNTLTDVDKAAANNNADALGAPAGYREAVEQALEDLRAGYFNEARGMFARAHELMPSAKTFWGLGMAEFELRSYVDSIEHLQQSLDSQVRPLAPEQRTRAQTLLERASRYVTRLSLELQPSSARVQLDGAPRPERKLLLAAGDHTLDVSASGYQTQTRVLHALGGEAQELSIVLTPERIALAPAPTPVPHDDQPRSLWKNPWLWTGVGVLVAGAVTTASVLATRDDGGPKPYGGTSGVEVKGL